MRGGVPKPIGCAWVRLRWNASSKAIEIMVYSDVRGADCLEINQDHQAAGIVEYSQDEADDQ